VYALGTDFIVGHPGETQSIWEEAMQNIQKFPLTHIHAFTYSKRDGTPSASMKQEVNGAIAKQRYNELMNIINEKNRIFRLQKSVLEVLIEQEKEGVFIGLDQFFNKVEVHSKADLVGDWIELKNYEVKALHNVATF
jgi:tRNA A37 methylthiotransferase MiaB